MREAVGALYVACSVALGGCYLSHELGERDGGRDAATRDAGHDASRDAGPPDLGVLCDGTYRTFLHAAARATCIGYARCAGAGPDYDHEIAAWLRDPESCTAALSAYDDWVFAYYGVELDRPERLDCTRVPGCLATMTECPTVTTPTPSEIFPPVPTPACDGLYLPPPSRADTGGVCAADVDCVTGNVCAVDYRYGSRGDCARCYALSGAGEQCIVAATCADAGLAEDVACVRDHGDDPLGVCGGARYLPESAEGGRCGLVARDGLVATYTRCATGLSCEWASPHDVVGTCVAPRPAGSPCGSPLGGWCAASLVCSAGTCQPLRLVTEGEACGMDALTVCDIAAHLACVGSTCVRVGAGALGDACDATDPYVRYLQCVPGLHCGTDGRCTADVPDGSACTDPYECASHACDVGACLSSVCPA